MIKKTGAGWGRIILMSVGHLLLQTLISLARPGWFFTSENVLYLRLLVVLVSTGLVLAAWLIGRDRAFEKGNWLGILGVWILLIATGVVAIFAPWELVSVSNWLNPPDIEYQLTSWVFYGAQGITYAAFTSLGLFHVHNKLSHRILILVPVVLGLLLMFVMMNMTPPVFRG